jgi:GMP synthase-like glutamine amidotransferase
MKVLIVRNAETAPEGAFGEWLARQGFAIEVVAGSALDEAALERADLVLLLGSPHGVYDTHIDWIARQRTLVAARLARQAPTIGICFGAQMIAAAAGGDCARMEDGRFFRGWHPIEEAAEPVFAGPWPRWHGDALTAPPQAEVLARDAGTVQAFTLPGAIGVQFHPEATPAILQSWAERPSTPEGLDRAAFAAESAEVFAARTAAREALFAELLRRAISPSRGSAT